MRDNNTQKMMTSNETRLTVAIADIIISEGLYFNPAQKHRFKKLLDLARIASKNYQPLNRKMILKTSMLKLMMSYMVITSVRTIKHMMAMENLIKLSMVITTSLQT